MSTPCRSPRRRRSVLQPPMRRSSSRRTLSAAVTGACTSRSQDRRNLIIPDAWGPRRMPNRPTQPLQSNLSRMLRRALRAYEQGECDKVERFYTAILHIHPDHFDALHGLGLINYRRGRLEAARGLIQAALQAHLDGAA